MVCCKQARELVGKQVVKTLHHNGETSIKTTTYWQCKVCFHILAKG